MKASLKTSLWVLIYIGNSAWKAVDILKEAGESVTHKEVREILKHWIDKGLYEHGDRYLFEGWFTEKGRSFGAGGPR